MNKKNMTPEEQYWYLKGYLDCFILDLSHDYKITEVEATRLVYNTLAPIVKL